MIKLDTYSIKLIVINISIGATSLIVLLLILKKIFAKRRYSAFLEKLRVKLFIPIVIFVAVLAAFLTISTFKKEGQKSISKMLNNLKYCTRLEVEYSLVLEKVIIKKAEIVDKDTIEKLTVVMSNIDYSWKIGDWGIPSLDYVKFDVYRGYSKIDSFSIIDSDYIKTGDKQTYICSQDILTKTREIIGTTGK